MGVQGRVIKEGPLSFVITPITRKRPPMFDVSKGKPLVEGGKGVVLEGLQRKTLLLFLHV